MKVWVVMESDYEWTGIDSVWASKKDAEAHASALNSSSRFSVEEHDVRPKVHRLDILSALRT